MKLEPEIAAVAAAVCGMSRYLTDIVSDNSLHALLTDLLLAAISGAGISHCFLPDQTATQRRVPAYNFLVHILLLLGSTNELLLLLSVFDTFRCLS